MPIYDDVTKLVGNTPLVRLNRITDGAGATVVAKLEFYNPANSVKDRIGVSMIDAAEASGQLQPGGTIVEATSGNTGIALAMVGAARGYRVVLTMPESMSKERRALLRAYGAELVLTPGPGGDEGRRGQGRGDRRLRRCRPGPPVRQRGQPEDPPGDHGRGDLEGHRRPGRHLRLRDRHRRHHHRRRPGAQGAQARRPGDRGGAEGLPDPERRQPGRHPIQGIGANFVPEILDTTVYDEVLDATNEDAVAWARRAAKEEGLLVGISSGAALWAAVEVAKRPENDGKLVVVVVPSFGERYLSTILYQDLLD